MPRLAQVAALGAFVALMLAGGCSDDADPTVTPTAPATPAAPATATATSTVGDAPALTLDDYLEELACDAAGPEPETNSDISALADETIGRMSALVPPAELADYHRAMLTLLERVRVSFDSLPPDGEIDGSTYEATFAEAAGEAMIREVIAELPEDIRRRLDASGCGL